MSPKCIQHCSVAHWEGVQQTERPVSRRWAYNSPLDYLANIAAVVVVVWLATTTTTTALFPSLVYLTLGAPVSGSELLVPVHKAGKTGRLATTIQTLRMLLLLRVLFCLSRKQSVSSAQECTYTHKCLCFFLFSLLFYSPNGLGKLMAPTVVALRVYEWKRGEALLRHVFTGGLWKLACSFRLQHWSSSH